MEVRLKLIERELFFCESELQSLCASNKWLGGVEGPTFLETLLLRRLTWEAFTDFFSKKDELLDKLSIRFPKKRRIYQHGKTVRFDPNSKVLRFSTMTCDMTVEGSEVCLKQGEGKQYLRCIKHLYIVLCSAYTYTNDGTLSQKEIAEMSGDVLTEYGDWY
jgi:hypothetical protein